MADTLHSSRAEGAPPDRRLVEQANAGLLGETAQLTMMVTPSYLLTTLATAVLFRGGSSAAYLIGLNVTMAILVAIALIAANHYRRLTRLRSGTPPVLRGLRRGFVFFRTLSAAFGLTWASIPAVLFDSTSVGYDLVVVGIATGVIAYTYVIGTILHASSLFIAPIVCGSFFGLAHCPQPFGPYLAILLVLYAALVATFTHRLSVLAFQRELSKATVLVQNETIGLLLRDFHFEASDWLWETDERGRLSIAPDRMAAMLGAPVAALPKDTTLTGLLAAAATDGAATAPIVTAMALRQPFSDVALELRTALGELRWWRLSGRPAGDRDGPFTGYRGVGSDITQMRRDEERIGYLASHDTLTAMPNRSSFLDAMEVACHACATRPFALLYVDLDGFKAVNDSHGHTLGDHLLTAVANRLRELDPACAAYRLGGDEFALILPITCAREAERLADGTLAALGQPFAIDGLSLTVGASVGIALAPADADDPASLLHRADLALYGARTGGKGRWARFDPALETRVHRRRMLDGAMREALACDRLDLHYQPIVDIQTGHIVGAEALLRFYLPGEGWVTPSELIPIAEATGFVREIGRWALMRACRDMSAWPDLGIAVNISPIHFRQPDFCDEVSHVLDATAIEPCRLEIEVTESMLMESGPAITGTIERLRALGVRIALDDFGTGYASLSYLRQFTFDKIKIDRAFVIGIDRDPEIAAIVGAIHTMADALHLSVTVEGVETHAQLQALRALSHGTVQGFHIGQARPIAAFADLLDAATIAAAVRPAVTSPVGMP